MPLLDDEIIFANEPDGMVDLAEMHEPYKNGYLRCRISVNGTERVTISLYATTAVKANDRSLGTAIRYVPLLTEGPALPTNETSRNGVS